MNADEYDHGAHTRDVYAHFGLAMYLVQVLEHSIVNFLMVMEILPTASSVEADQWELQIDQFYEDKFKHTLGKLKNQAAAYLPDHLKPRLQDAKEKRDYLAHQFFRVHAEDFLRRDGKSLMIGELQRLQNLFKSTDKDLEEFMFSLSKKHGFTKEALDRAMEDMMKSLHL